MDRGKLFSDDFVIIQNHSCILTSADWPMHIVLSYQTGLGSSTTTSSVRFRSLFSSVLVPSVVDCTNLRNSPSSFRVVWKYGKGS